MDSSTEASLRLECLKHFFDESEFDFKPAEGGINNFTSHVSTKNGDYIIRIYNNGNNSKRVEFEHAILTQLLDMKLSFETPRPLLSKDGKTHVVLSTGTEGAVFHKIKGTLPKINDIPLIKNIGKATGELLNALAKVKLDNLQIITPPYYELYQVHHAITRENFLEEAKSDKFDGVREPTDYLVNEILELEQKIDEYHKLNLPTQLIHGDFHHDNMLTEGYDVTAALDFEFASIDWRAMDVAITLSKFAAEKEPMPFFEAFIEGFAEQGELNENEIKAVPSLIILRIVSNFVYFVGRYIAKEDSVETCTKKMHTYCNRVKWLKKNDEVIQAYIAKNLKDKKH